MKIEISEISVTRTDAITLERTPSAVGIAALEPRTAPTARNLKRYRFPSITALLRFVPLKLKRCYIPIAGPVTFISVPNRSKNDCLYGHPLFRTGARVSASGCHGRLVGLRDPFST
jgi:hypothetical protein